MAAFDDATRETEVDRLYQLPLEQFIKARSELAKQVGRSGGAAVRTLAKPNVLAWALNQLYWSKRDTFDRLVAAAARLRATQADALMGRRADLRAAGEAHREAIAEALREAAAILQAAGHPVTPDAVRELTGALEALPWKERPGRLVRPPAASGFEALAGLPVAPAERPKTRPKAPPAAEKRQPAKSEPTASAARGSNAVARREREAAVKAARAGATAARREEARAASRLARAEKELGAAAEREKAARLELADAERDRSRAEDVKRFANAALEEARRGVREATQRLAEADETT